MQPVSSSPTMYLSVGLVSEITGHVRFVRGFEVVGIYDIEIGKVLNAVTISVNISFPCETSTGDREAITRRKHFFKQYNNH